MLGTRRSLRDLISMFGRSCCYKMIETSFEYIERLTITQIATHSVYTKYCCEAVLS